MNNEEITLAQQLIDAFDDRVEENPVLDDKAVEDIASIIPSTEELAKCLPELLKKSNGIKKSIDDCDKNIKTWQESKKMWSSRSKSFMDILGKIISTLNITGNTLKSGGVKLSTSSRTALEVDEGWLIGQYDKMIDALQRALPVYMKVNVTIDKNKLAAYLKDDKSLLTNNPDKVHTKLTTSTSIK